MKNEVLECNVESLKNDLFPEDNVKVEAKFYDGAACEYIISVKSTNGSLYNMLKMFAKHFAVLEYYKSKGRKDLEPIAIAIANEIARHDLGGEEKGEKLLENWIKSSFQSLQSGHGV